MSGNPFLEPARARRRRALLAAVFALILVALAGYLLGSGHGGTSAQPAAAPTGHPATAAPTAAALPTAGATDLGAIQLVAGSAKINGLSVGYPQSTVGAISAAVEYITQLGTLDPDWAATVARLAADTSYTNAASDWANGVTASRTQLGISATGAVPSGASLIVEPVEYQLREVTGDKVLVLLLADMTSTTASGGAKTQLAVFPMAMHWGAGDWKFLPFDNSANWIELAATPGTAAAADKGWAQFRLP